MLREIFRLPARAHAFAVTAVIVIVATHAAFFSGIAYLFGDDPWGKAWRGEDYTQLVLVALATLLLGKKSIDLMFRLVPAKIAKIVRD